MPQINKKSHKYEQKQGKTECNVFRNIPAKLFKKGSREEKYKPLKQTVAS